MLSTKCKKFKGEIENYLRNRQNQFESKIDRLLVSLRLKAWLRHNNIIKKDGYDRPIFDSPFSLSSSFLT